MPKPLHRNQQWVDHDDTNRQDRTTRRVSFKPNRHGGKRDGGRGGRDWTASIRAHLQDEDVDMGGTSVDRIGNARRGRRGQGRRPGSPAPSGMNGPPRRPLFEDATRWYRVTLFHGDKYEKSFLQKVLLDNLRPLPFWPICWEVKGVNVSFFVDEYRVASKLLSLDRQLQMPNGFKQAIRVFSDLPNLELTTEKKEKIKFIMAKRYNAATKALDLTKFHCDPDLQETPCPLNTPECLLAIIDIIADNIPDLEALNLGENKLITLRFLKKTIKKLDKLKILHLGGNRLRKLMELDVLMGLPIIELFLDGNPLCTGFQDQTTYVSEVRKRLPKVLKLDGIDLPPPIVFDISEEVALPPSAQTFLSNGAGGAIVRGFLEQYIQIYDTDNRQPLLQAYHENAMFSMTSAYPYGHGKDRNGAWLNWYNTDNRNLLKVLDGERRNRLLLKGQLAVVGYLQDMPKTKHDIHSFTVDLTLFTEQMLCLTVSGMFKELKSGHKIPPLRFFFKTLVIVPSNSGYCIANEELFISNATPDQTTHAFKLPDLPPVPAVVVTAPTPRNSLEAQLAALPLPSQTDEAMKQQMVMQMAERSGMNFEWSLKCLEETQWDFQTATTVFDKLQSEGRIPADAFVK